MRLSILDFQTAAGALELAPAAERLGFHRYWLGEHHSRYQCANPLLLATVLAGLTERMRIGTGGVCLDYATPYRVAEDARLAAYLFPDRLDLGLARGLGYPAPLHAALGGGDGGGGGAGGAESFAARATAVHQFVTGRLPGGHPLEGTELHLEAGPPVWILGTSPSAARLAATLGAGLCLSLHHAPDEAAARVAIAAYRAAFAPSPEFAAPAVLAVVSGVCAEDGPTAVALAAEIAARAGAAGGPPGFAGNPGECAALLTALAARLDLDELMILDFLDDWERRARMYELLAGALDLAAPH